MGAIREGAGEGSRQGGREVWWSEEDEEEKKNKKKGNSLQGEPACGFGRPESRNKHGFFLSNLDQA